MKLPTLLILMIAGVVLPSCKPSGPPAGVHKFDTVTFDLTTPPAASAKPVPTVWLDTNMEVDGLFGGGTVKSSKPYHIRIDYTDNISSFATLVVTKVKVVYDDGTVEDGTKGAVTPEPHSGKRLRNGEQHRWWAHGENESQPPLRHATGCHHP